MSRFCLCVARLLLTAWVGAALLFVINGVSTVGKVTSEVFDIFTAIRFPNYYLFGFIAVISGLFCLLISLPGSVLPRWRHVLGILLAAGALGLMVYDYRQIYLPLEAMITPPGKARPMDFRPLHQQSEIFNAIHVGLCLLAAVAICWPAPRPREPRPSDDST